MAATPPSYHQIVSPTLRIPDDPAVSIPVGILACQRDPLLRSLHTTVVSATEHQPPPPPAANKGKKAVLAPELPAGPLLAVLLHDTVIFPEGGGQPTDTGSLSAAGRDWAVVQCKRHAAHAVHYVRVPEGTAASDALRVFAPGAPVSVSVDWERRYDHMTLHTAQHLLSALLETRLQLPTLSWSLTGYPAPCYVEVPRSMTPEEIASVQDAANRLVFEGRRVHVEVQEMESKDTAAAGRASGRGLPGDYTGGVHRVIVIDGVDRNPCCGTHLPSLHNLQLFLLPHTDALARTTTRLHFLAGPRLPAHLAATHARLAAAAGTLSCGLPDVPARVALGAEERRRAERRAADVERELAAALAAQLLAGAPRRHVHRADDTPGALAFLVAIAAACEREAGAAGREAAAGGYLLVLSSSPAAQSAGSVSVVCVCGSDEGQVQAVGAALRSGLGVRGGGRGARWTGKRTGVWRVGREGAVVEEALASV
ncbi:Threonyl/alanyl tRNA synthetase [Schizophyllum fasciatum]